ncbi:MAG: hypothetical protein QM692_01400 [Thermomicrobiales bacterium]
MQTQTLHTFGKERMVGERSRIIPGSRDEDDVGFELSQQPLTVGYAQYGIAQGWIELIEHRGIEHKAA